MCERIRMDSEKKILISKRESAQLLGLCVRTMEELVRRGELVPRRIGRRVLFRREELERFAKVDGRNSNFRAARELDVVD